MFRALLYLRSQSLKNLLWRRARRLRQPGYLFAALVTAIYFYNLFFRRMGVVSGGPHGGASTAMFAVSAVAMAPIMLGRPLLTWLGAAGRAGLGFSEAEIAFLFPAPVTRRALIHYHLLSSQLTTFLSAIILAAVSSRWPFFVGNPFTRIVGWWVVSATLSLHQTAAALTVARLDERGVSAARRRTVVLGLAAAFMAAFLFSLEQHARLPQASDFSTGTAFQDYVAAVFNSGWMPWLLWPVKILVRPFLAHGAAAFLISLEPALLLLAAHYIWAMRVEAGFEEGSIAIAQKRSQRRAARQAGGAGWAPAPRRGIPEPFRLAGPGRPETAFLWKNLLSVRSSVNWRLLLMPAVLVFSAVPAIFTRGAAHLGPVIAIILIALAAMTVIVGPQYARQDLRGDLLNADLLKTYPLAGWQIVLAEMLAPAAMLSGVFWFLLLAATLALTPPAGSWLTPPVLAAVVLCLAAVVPVICLFQLFVPNAAVLFFPAWHQLGRSRGGGVEAIGQRLISLFGQLLLLLLALLPAAVTAALLIFASSWLLGPVSAILLGTAGVLVILVGELWIGLWVLGRRFEKFDLSTELRG